MNLADAFIGVFAHVAENFSDQATPARPYEKVRAEIVALLDAARTKGESLPQAELDEALFAVCAWIDERILYSSWSGRNDWQIDTLQAKFFGTTSAGVEFFERVEKLGADQLPLRQIYALCLRLGFKGRFFADPRGLDEVAQRNLIALGTDGKTPLRLDASGDPGPIVRVQAGTPSRDTGPLKTAALILVAIAVASVLASILFDVFALVIALAASAILAGGAGVALSVIWPRRFRRRIDRRWGRVDGSSPRHAGLQARWEQALEAERSRPADRAYLQVFVLGADGSGKTTAIKAGGAHELLGNGKIEDRSCRIWLGPEALYLEVPGPNDLVEAAGNLRALLDVVRVGRDDLGGACCVVTVGADVLSRNEHVLSDLGMMLRRDLDRVMAGTGKRLAMTLLITKLDLVPGMSALLEVLDPEERIAPLGRSGGASATEAVQQAIGALARCLAKLRLELLARSRAAASMLRLPDEIAKLEPGALKLVTALFEDQAARESPLFHGIFFTAAANSQPAFLREVFVRALPASRAAACPLRDYQHVAWVDRWARWLRAAAACTAAAGLVVGALALMPPAPGPDPVTKVVTDRLFPIRWITTASGLRYRDERVGKGAAPQAGSSVKVTYHLVVAGEPVDADKVVESRSESRFVVGTGQLIKGLDELIMGMKVGGIRSGIIPPELAFGENGRAGVVPKNATLKVRVELLGAGI